MGGLDYEYRQRLLKQKSGQQHASTVSIYTKALPEQHFLVVHILIGELRIVVVTDRLNSVLCLEFETI